MTPHPKRIFLLGATGTIGRATLAELLRRGHHVTCLIRPDAALQRPLPTGAILRQGQITDAAALLQDTTFDAIVSCLASRTGTPATAWAIDHRAHCDILAMGRKTGVAQMVLLSALCVQKPTLAFQQAKLAFEAELVASGLTYSIVRPTAFFKSLSGQIDRVRRGKPFLVFGDGRATACKPISNADLASYLVRCLEDPALHNRILPIGGPGPAMTPLEQGQALFALLNRPPRFRHVPLGLLDAIIAVLDAGGRLSPALRDKAELARIGRYYASESMLVLNPATGRYDADATPSTGTDSLPDHYARLIAGKIADDRGDHAVF